MRWEQLFGELESRFDELADAVLRAELADRERVAAGAVRFSARLGGAVGQAIRVRTSSAAPVGGTIRRVGPDWVLLSEVHGREALVNLAQVTVVEGLVSATAPPIGGVALRLDLRHMLRGLARDRAPVSVVVTGSSGELPGSDLSGTLDRVGADFVELALHAPWEPRRATGVRSVVALPLTAVVLVRALPLG